jgi:hypothetical protein
MDAIATVERLRRFLLLVFVLGSAATALELVLMHHYEDPWQWLPIALLVLGLGLAAAAAHGRGLRAFRVVMLLFGVAGLIGLGLHFRASAEFELERDPGLAGLALFLEAIQGVAPPALAPAALAGLGLIGWRWSAPASPSPHPSPSETGS